MAGFSAGPGPHSERMAKAVARTRWVGKQCSTDGGLFGAHQKPERVPSDRSGCCADLALWAAARLEAGLAHPGVVGRSDTCHWAGRGVFRRAGSGSFERGAEVGALPTRILAGDGANDRGSST